MSNDWRTICCPYCGDIINCGVNSNERLVIRGHSNRSVKCKQKRERLEEDVSNVISGKHHKTEDVGEDFKPLRKKDDRAQVFSPYWHRNDKETDDLDGQEIQAYSGLEATNNDFDNYIIEHDDVDSMNSEVMSLGKDGSLLDEEDEIFTFEELNELVTSAFDNGFPMDVGIEQKYESKEDSFSSCISRADCRMNEMLRIQDLMKLFFFDNMPARFNRVFGEEVDVESALVCLNHMVELQMTEAEADDFLGLVDHIVSSQTGKVFPMPIRSKTLHRAFLGKADRFFPLEDVILSVLPQIFEKDEIPPLRKPMIKLEDTFATLLLKVDPANLTKECIALFESVNGTDERLYEGFCTGDYPLDIQKEMWKNYEVDYDGVKPLLIFYSMFIDGALMNRHSRSATPIVLTILNDSSKNSALVGFCSKKLHITDEELDAKLTQKGVKGVTKLQELRKLALRQCNWDYCYSMIGSFQARQKKNKGFDVQIGLGNSAEFHRVVFVCTNCIGDHPQVHEMTGVKTNACHVCVNMHPFNFAVSDKNRDGVGTFDSSYELRNPVAQYNSASKHSHISLKVIKSTGLIDVLKRRKNSIKKMSKKDVKNVNQELKDLGKELNIEKQNLKEATVKLAKVNSRSGDITPYLMFEDLIKSGVCVCVFFIVNIF